MVCREGVCLAVIKERKDTGRSKLVLVLSIHSTK